jgi:hypothetical protein
MLAGEVYLLTFGRVYCAKLHHDNDKSCIFHHTYETRAHAGVRQQPFRGLCAGDDPATGRGVGEWLMRELWKT